MKRTVTCVLGHKRTFRWFSRLRAALFLVEHLHPEVVDNAEDDWCFVACPHTPSHRHREEN